MFAAGWAGSPVLVTDPAAPAVALPAHLPPETFLVVVTSGTSGHPRPVLRTADSWICSFAPFEELTGIGPTDRVLLTGPLHATMHLFAAVHTLSIGAHLVDDPAIATAAHAVPARLATLLDELDRPDLGPAPLRTVVVAGAPLPDELADRARARGLGVVEYYGAAELSFVAARRAPGPLRPFPGAQVDLRSGVLWVRSPYVSLGYPPGVTGPFRQAEDGFATVGDLAEIAPGGADPGNADPAGADPASADLSSADPASADPGSADPASAGPAGPGLRIRGRGDAAVTTGGATVVAEDVEQVLLTLPGVAAVAVVGVAHPRLGQLVVAVLEPVPGADLNGIRGAARRVLRGPSLPRRWLVTDALPRTPGGKVARHRVSAALATLDAGEPAPAGPTDGPHTGPAAGPRTGRADGPADGLLSAPPDGPPDGPPTLRPLPSTP